MVQIISITLTILLVIFFIVPFISIQVRKQQQESETMIIEPDCVYVVLISNGDIRTLTPVDNLQAYPTNQFVEVVIVAKDIHEAKVVMDIHIKSKENA